MVRLSLNRDCIVLTVPLPVDGQTVFLLLLENIEINEFEQMRILFRGTADNSLVVTRSDLEKKVLHVYYYTYYEKHVSMDLLCRTAV